MSEFEHGQLGPWGYVYDAEKLPDFITTTDFLNFTNGKFGTTDTRIVSNIASASEAIRNYCGWHIWPSLYCGMLYDVQSLRDAFVGPDLLIQLPATYVSEIVKVVLGAKWNSETDDWDGETIDDPDRFGFSVGRGLLKVYDVGQLDRRSKIFVGYVAGLPSTPEAIKELTTSRVVNSIANPYGVASETAGGVSVSYSATWSGRSNSTSLPDDARETLNMYKVKGVF